ncbi:MAG: bifunctional serine/threonine-protein kinase/formylglycine-generating enzyme family protein [Planctomycetota bacterium]
MNSAEWERVQELFHAARELDAEERGSFLGGLDESDEVLRTLRRMLADDAASSDLPSAMSPADALSAAKAAAPAETVSSTSGPIGAGTRLDDYELREEVGRGGMGAVFRARQISLDRIVALKVLPIHLLTRPDTVARFEREGQMAARLHHPGIISIYAVGQTGDARYIAMEYFARGDLGKELSRARRREATTFLKSSDTTGHAADCARRIASVADAVQHAHEQGLLHRDIKPQNLLIGSDGELRLADFGLARDRRLEGLTEEGAMLGTLAYMSPEQATRATTAVDERTDVYSLGVVLYEMLAERPAFEGGSHAELLHKITTAEPAPLRRVNRRVPSDLALICACAMAKDPRERYASAGAFAGDLRRFLNHESIFASPPTPMTVLRRHLLSRWKRYAGIAAATLLGIVAFLTAGRIDRARVLGRDFAEISAVLTDDAWGARTAAERAETISLIRRYRREGDALSPPRRAQLVEFERELDEKERAMRDAGLALIERGYRAPRSTEPVDAQAIERGFLQLAEADHLFGSDPASDVLEALRATIDVEVATSGGAPISAAVTLQELDPNTSVVVRSTSIGRTPVRSHSTSYGLVRVLVGPPTDPLAEFTRVLERGTRALRLEHVEGRARPLDGELVPVAGGRFEDPDHGSVEVAPFAIQRGAVTVAQYLAYMEATGLGPPAFWAPLGSTDGPWQRLTGGAFSDHPMTGVSYEEAQAFAEWHGLRLPTLMERRYLVASGVLNGVRIDLDQSLELTDFPESVPEVDVETRTRSERMADNYFANALPALGSGTRTGDVGVLELLTGNVREWTETVPSFRAGDRTMSLPRMRIAAGCSWQRRSLSTATHRAISLTSVGPGSAVPTIGFRCAATRQG